MMIQTVMNVKNGRDIYCYVLIKRNVLVNLILLGTLHLIGNSLNLRMQKWQVSAAKRRKALVAYFRRLFEP